MPEIQSHARLFWAVKLPVLSARGREMAGFAIRTWLASLLALYMAFALQLDSPHWAWLTVWIVAQPRPGMMLSKSLYRVVGTVAGAIFGVILISLFAQTPELFVVALALLVAGCTVASGVLTNFRAYATVLAAYTAGIVASDAINSPDQVFFIAMARGSCVLIGIASAVLVTSIFAPHRAEDEVQVQLRGLLKDAARRAAYSWRGQPDVRRQMGKKLIDEAIALDTLIEFAAAESGAFRLQANNARSLLAHVFGIISARRSLDAHLNRCGWPRSNALEIFHEVILDFLNEMPGELDRSRVEELIAGLREVRRQLDLLHPEETTISSGELVSERLVIDRLDDLLEHLGGALEDWRDILEGRWQREPTLVLNFHRDLRAAWINGLRAFLAVAATGAFWIGTAWPHGPLALVFVSIMMSLFSSHPRPDRVGWGFFYASLPAVVLALVCKYLVLPMESGFEFLALASGLFLLPLGLFMAYPATNGAAVAFSLVFLNVVQPGNPMTYDLADSINTAIAIEVGVLFGTLAYVLLFPPNPLAAYRYVTYRIRLGLQQLASRRHLPAVCSWETRMYDRVNRLHDPQNLSGTPTDEWLEAGLGALTLGNEILRLRHGLGTGKLSPRVRAPVEATIGAFRRFCSEGRRAADAVKQSMHELAGLDPGPGRDERQAWARSFGALAEIDVYLAQHPRLMKIGEAA
jgi:uncharacterized membrane protein YccC